MGKRILIIDDDPAVREVIALLLISRGFEPILAGDSHEGLNIIQERSPDLVITDLSMPGRLSGLDLIVAIRADPELHNLPIIAMSGSGAEDAKTALRAGADREIRKPHLGRLVDEIHELFSKSSRHTNKRGSDS